MELADLFRNRDQFKEALMYNEFLFEFRKRSFDDIEEIISRNLYCSTKTLKEAEAAYDSIAWAYSNGNKEQAHPYFKMLYKIRKKLYGEKDDKTISTAETIKQLFHYADDDGY